MRPALPLPRMDPCRAAVRQAKDVRQGSILLSRRYSPVLLSRAFQNHDMHELNKMDGSPIALDGQQ